MLDIDVEGGDLYWTDRGELPHGNSLNRIKLSALDEFTVPQAFSVFGPLPYEVLARGLHEAIGLKVDTLGRRVYVADLGGAVYEFSMDGKEKRRIIEHEGNFTGLTLWRE